MALYRNTAIRRYRVGRFEFNDHTLHVADDDQAEFLRLIDQLPRQVVQNIVEINESAAAALTRPLSVHRGPVTADNLPTQQLIRDAAKMTAQMQAPVGAVVSEESPNAASNAARVADLGAVDPKKDGGKLQ